MSRLVDYAPCLNLVLRDDGSIADVNERMSAALGYSKADLLRKNSNNIFSVATKIFFQTHLFPLLRMQGFAEEIYFTLLTATGNEVPLLVNASRENVEGVHYVLFSGILVNNRKKFEDELVASKKSAEKALKENTELLGVKKQLQEHAKLLDEQVMLVTKKNEELREFNRIVTHDMQEPLRKISFFTNMLVEKKEFEPGLIEKLTRVVGNLQSILKSLQQYIWLTEREVKPVQLNLESVILHARSKLDCEYKEMAIEVVTKDLPQLFADREQMQFLFLELMTNAVRFRKDEQAVQINISAHSLLLNEFRAVSGNYNYVEFYKIQVEDNGSGFDDIYKHKVFSLFEGLHENSGRGVGLALCKKIVENHNGKISIESTKGIGTTVTIFLPKRADSNPAFK